MRLARLGERGAERPVVFDSDGRARDLAAVIGDLDGAALAPQGLARIAALDLATLPVVPDDRFGACVAHVGKIVCVGLNYVDHATESGFAAPAEPVVFMKATSAVAGANDDIERPRGDDVRLDYEVELGVVIGTKAKYVDARDAMDHVAGYCIVNDVSERALQLERGGQWVKGKSFDGFAPIGPWFVTADEVPDPAALRLRTLVNGDVRQDAAAADMVFDVPTLIAYISGFTTLLPGDVIATGTPPGVGLGLRPPRYLAVGDDIRLEISGLGVQHQRVVPPSIK